MLIVDTFLSFVFIFACVVSVCILYVCLYLCLYLCFCPIFQSCSLMTNALHDTAFSSLDFHSLLSLISFYHFTRPRNRTTWNVLISLRFQDILVVSSSIWIDVGKSYKTLPLPFYHNISNYLCLYFCCYYWPWHISWHFLRIHPWTHPWIYGCGCGVNYLFCCFVKSHQLSIFLIHLIPIQN